MEIFGWPFLIKLHLLLFYNHFTYITAAKRLLCKILLPSQAIFAALNTYCQRNFK
jgi:hypothetical protein